MSRLPVSRCARVVAVAVLAAAWLTSAEAGQNAQSPLQPLARTHQAPPAPAGPLAPDKYMNIQILKDLPAAQLHDVMVYMEAALGANCTFCHVRNEAGEFAFEKDDRTNKKTTREMIQMQKTINAQNFKGQVEVSCTTCHQGRRTPNAIPQLAEMLTAEQLAARPPQGPGPGAAPPPAPSQGAGVAPGQPAPAASGSQGSPASQRQRPPVETLDQVADKLIQAMGGADALQKLTSRSAKGTVTSRYGQASAIRIDDTAAGQYRIDIDGALTSIRAFDGKTAWTQGGDRVRELEGIEATLVSMSADLGLALHLKDRYQNLAVRAYDRIDGREVIVLQGRVSPLAAESLSVDKASGLLLRRVVRFTTALGRLSAQIDYSDFRPVAGVTLPFAVKVTNWDSVSDQKFTEITINPGIVPSRFAKPVSKSSQ
jgi:hypothetical protein